MRFPSAKIKGYNQENIRRLLRKLLRKRNELEEKDEALTAIEGKTLVTEQPLRVGLTQLEVISSLL